MVESRKARYPERYQFEDGSSNYNYNRRQKSGRGGNKPPALYPSNHRSSNRRRQRRKSKSGSLSNALTISSPRPNHSTSLNNPYELSFQSSHRNPRYRPLKDLRHKRYYPTIRSILSEGAVLEQNLIKFMHQIRQIMNFDPEEMDWDLSNQTIIVKDSAEPKASESTTGAEGAVRVLSSAGFSGERSGGLVLEEVVAGDEMKDVEGGM